MLDWGGEEVIPFMFNEILPPEKAFASLLSICKDLPMNIRITFSQIKNNIRSRQRYKERIEKQIQCYREKNSRFLPIFEAEYASLCVWTKREQKVRTFIRILVHKWIQKKYKDRILNTEDPCTLLPPVKTIKLFDHACRGFHQFEASSLKKQFETSLQYSEWLFPKPTHPKNPFTNLPFNEGQRITIVNSLRKYGYGSWFIEAYRNSGWNLVHFTIDNSINLRINSITQLCKNPNHETQEFLDEFITNQYTENEINKPIILTVLKWAVKNRIDDLYMKKWLQLMKEYYTIKYRYSISDNSEDIKLNIIYVRSMQLFDNIHKIEEFKTSSALVIQPQASPIDETESESESESEMSDNQVIGNIIYIQQFDANIEQNIEEIINQLINEHSDL